MAAEYKLSYTGKEINEKLGKIDGIERNVSALSEEIADYSWNDLKDKPFGDEMVEIMPETEVIAVDADGMYVISLSLPLDHIPETLLFIYDGVEYVCHNNTTVGGLMGAPAVYGNAGLIGMEDTGEPFFFAPMDMLVTDGEPHTLSIYEVVTISIPEKYRQPRKLYWSSKDDYLYIDETLTTKATQNDIPDSGDFVLGFCQASAVAQWYKPQSWVSKRVSEYQGYGHVYLLRGIELVELYTAEYTT